MVEILNLIFNRDSEIVLCSRFVNCELWSCDVNSTLGSVVPLAMFFLATSFIKHQNRSKVELKISLYLFSSVEDILCIILSIHFLKLSLPENGWISMDQSVRVKPNKNSLDKIQNNTLGIQKINLYHTNINTRPKITKIPS